MSPFLLGRGLGVGLLGPVARPLPVPMNCQAACAEAVGAVPSLAATLSPALSVVCVLSLGPRVGAPPAPRGLIGTRAFTGPPSTRSPATGVLIFLVLSWESWGRSVDASLCRSAVCGYFLPISISAFSQQDLSNEQQFLILMMSNSSRLFFFPCKVDVFLCSKK